MVGLAAWQDMDFSSEALVLHSGGDESQKDVCVKCFQSPPAVKLVSPGKCFVCHSTHMLAFGEYTWAVTCQSDKCGLR